MNFCKDCRYFSSKFWTCDSGQEVSFITGERIHAGCESTRIRNGTKEHCDLFQRKPIWWKRFWRW